VKDAEVPVSGTCGGNPKKIRFEEQTNLLLEMCWISYENGKLKYFLAHVVGIQKKSGTGYPTSQSKRRKN
jgi:hypothetical protein